MEPTFKLAFAAAAVTLRVDDFCESSTLLDLRRFFGVSLHLGDVLKLPFEAFPPARRVEDDNVVGGDVLVADALELSFCGDSFELRTLEFAFETVEVCVVLEIFRSIFESGE